MTPKQFAPIPLVQAGGIQPFHGSTPQMPGDALMAMMAGSMFGGFNPMNAQRGLQAAAKKRPAATLLDSLRG